jgi:hypothetical protein
VDPACRIKIRPLGCSSSWFRNVVGLYVDPPERAIVLSVDEKSQVQAY